MKQFALVGLIVLNACVGCAQPEYNSTPTKSESEALSDIIQLTDGFERAGEAYFSRDMQWIIFQAFPKGEDQYQMYAAPLMYDVTERSPKMGEARYATPMPNLKIPVAKDIIRAGEPIRITPPKSRNTCGYFSPDGNSIIFGSTAGKDNPEEPSSGYQRQGGTYRWSFPPGMEIFRADGWRQAIESAEPGKTVDLAKHAITNNDGYDAEGSYSPDGRWIVFTSSIAGDMEICAMRADGSGFVQLTHEKGYDGGPFFSPDAKRIVYRSDRKGNDLLQVFVADVVYDHVGNITGIKNERQLNHDGNVNWGPFWHPDGRHIIYATSLHGHHNYELYLMRDDGKRKTRITFSEGADLLPTFSADGKYLMWTSKRTKDKTTQVFLAKFKFPKGS
jgi:TolB protein